MEYQDYPVNPRKRSWELQARKAMRQVKRDLENRGFVVSPIHYCKGGPAVMGEVSFYAYLQIGEIDARRTRAIYVQAHHSLLDGRPSIMYRFEQWPEHLGGERSHRRMGPNHFCSLLNPDIGAIAQSAEEFNRSL